MEKKEKQKPTLQIKSELIVFLCFIFILTGMTIGFAHYSKLFQIQGVATVKPQGIVHFTELSLISSTNVDTSYQPSFTDETLDFNLHFSETDPNAPYSATYQITIQNDTFYNQSFQGVNFNPIIKNGDGVIVNSSTFNIAINGISENDTIASGASTTFTVTLTFTPPDPNDTYTVDGEATVTTETDEETGSLYITLTGTTTGDLRENNIRAPFTISVINTHSTNQTFNLQIGNSSHYSLTDSSGNSLGAFTIDAGATENYTFYVERLSSAIFTTDQETTLISSISTNNERSNVGTVTLLVDETAYSDVTAPTISDVSLSLSSAAEGRAIVTWNGTDDVAPTGYTVEIYNSNNDTKIGTYNTLADETNMTIDNLSTGTYYVKVYGVDAAGNTATSSEIANCSTSSGHCSRSSSVPMQWRFNVTNNLTNLNSNGASTALIGSTYTATLSTSSFGRSLPRTITVVMGGTTLSSGSDYTYNSNSGQISIPNVSGDITITASASGGCLVEGTLVELADGTKKPIEKITYDDLLLVWSYEDGEIAERYPVWIEKEAEAASYRKIEFSDGTILKTVAGHGVFSVELNRFVSVDNPKEFYVGTHIYKLNNSKTLEPVEVVNISIINEKTKYYHVVSTDFYNIFTNNMLTTDDEVILSNFYGFDEGVKWPTTRSEIIKDKNNLYDYSDFDFMPRWMFDGMRVEEGKYLDRIGILPKEIFIEYLKNNQLNPEMYLPRDSVK
ncbi:hypothetical protein IKT18_03570 [Candidatus Saccharibacteria bacterium]|nr:hypothetical protein [Candidatus Saccharibacteria bacterium]